MSNLIARFVCTALLLTLAPRALPAAVPIPAEAVYEDTVLVLRIHADRVPPDKVRPSLLAFFSPETVANWEDSLSAYEKFYADFTKAGGAAITMALRFSAPRPKDPGTDTQTPSLLGDPQPLIVVTPRSPVDHQTFEKTIINLIPDTKPNEVITAWRSDELLISVPEVPFPPAQTMSPARLADFNQAINEAGPKASFTIIFLPTQPVRQFIRANFIDPQSIDTLWAMIIERLVRVRHISLSGELDADAALTLTIGCKDEISARVLKTLLSSAITIAMPSVLLDDPEATEANEDTREIIESLKPTQSGSAVTIRVDARVISKVDELIEHAFAAPLAEGIVNAVVTSLANMHVIGAGIHTYAINHDGNPPDSLDVLVQQNLIEQQQLTNTRTGETPGYIYVKPAGKITQLTQPEKIPMLYESINGQIDPDGAILYADGHIDPGVRLRPLFDQ